MVDDPLLVVATLFPLLLLVTGLGFVVHALRMHLPAEVEAHVLEALSTHEARPIARICAQPALNGVDAQVVHFALDHLRRTGRAVRWYGDDDEAVYRRVA